MSKLIELSLKSIEWNKRKLPDNTLEMQLKKIDEEFNEAIEAADKQENINELADVFIAISGIGRFSVERYYAGLFAFFTEIDTTDLDMEVLEEAVEKKLKVIDSLNYVVVNDVYRHISLN